MKMLEIEKKYNTEMKNSLHRLKHRLDTANKRICQYKISIETDKKGGVEK